LTLPPVLPILAAMTEKSRPSVTERGRSEAALRQERLAAALRENLKKRKAQARDRTAKPENGEEGEG
jgi:hypothetical protein